MEENTTIARKFEIPHNKIESFLELWQKSMDNPKVVRAQYVLWKYLGNLFPEIENGSSVWRISMRGSRIFVIEDLELDGRTINNG